MHAQTVQSRDTNVEVTVRLDENRTIEVALHAFDQLWADAPWVPASERLRLELAVVDMVTDILTRRHAAPVHATLRADAMGVAARLTHTGPPMQPPATDRARADQPATPIQWTDRAMRRYLLCDIATYRAGPNRSIAEIARSIPPTGQEQPVPPASVLEFSM